MQAPALQKGLMRPEYRDTLTLMVGTVIGAALGMVYSAVAGQVLGPERFGEVAAAAALVLAVQTALGPINGTVTRFTAEYAARGALGKIATLSREVSKRVVWWGGLGTLAALLFVRPLADLLQFQSAAPLIIAVVMTYITLVLSVGRGVLRGLQAYGPYNRNIVAEGVLRITSGAALLYLWVSVSSALMGYLVAVFVCVIYAQRQTQSVWRDVPPESVDGGAVRRFTWPMFVLMFASAGYQHLDVLFVKHWFAPEAAGHYGAAVTLTRAVGVLVTPFTLVLLPLLTTRHEQGQGTLGSLARFCGGFLLVVAGPAAALALWGEWIVVKLYGAAYAPAAGILVPLCVARVLGYMCHMAALAGASVDRFRFLRVYVALLIVQTTGFLLWNDALHAIVYVMIVVQGAVLLLVLAELWRAGRRY